MSGVSPLVELVEGGLLDEFKNSTRCMTTGSRLFWLPPLEDPLLVSKFSRSFVMYNTTLNLSSGNGITVPCCYKRRTLALTRGH